MASALLITSLLIVLTVVQYSEGSVVAGSGGGGGGLSVCIQNCGQCKKMYGDFFLGQQCAEECLYTMGFSIPDCNKASSFQRFLGR